MAQPYVGEIRIFAGNFAPAGWMMCSGQILPISEFETLFNLIGTTYGGDGQSTFALPDLQSRVPIHQGQGFTLAENGGVETVTLTASQIPAHTHPALAATEGNSGPAGAYWSTDPGGSVAAYVIPVNGMNPDVSINPDAIVSSGGSQPHDNMQPYLTLNFIISLFGIFPSQT